MYNYTNTLNTKTYIKFIIIGEMLYAYAACMAPGFIEVTKH